MPEGRAVGPVLIANASGCALARAIGEAVPEAVIEDCGGYLRVSAPPPCAVSRGQLEHQLGRACDIREEVLRVMTSFRGKLSLDSEEAIWC